MNIAPEVDFQFVATLPYAPSAARKLEIFKRENGIETHYFEGFMAEGRQWLACHMPSAREVAEGYEDFGTGQIGLCDLFAGYCRLIQEAELCAEEQTEREAVQQLCFQIGQPFTI